jgi:Ala-tRNA(Pro) deacylase
MLPPMTDHKTRTGLFSYLDQLGIKSHTLEHPAVFTVSDSHEIEAALPGGHTKNLFLKDAKDKLFLVVALASTPIDLKKLPAIIGSGRLSFGKAELMQEVLGVMPGSVTVFSLINDAGHRVSLVLDQALMAHDTINAHPLENTATTGIAREDLMRFISACGHTAKIVALDAAAANA